MCVFFFKQKAAYDMRISYWSSDVCSADLNTMRFISVALPLSRIDWILFLLSALDTGEAAAATPHARRSVGPGAGRSRAPSGMTKKGERRRSCQPRQRRIQVAPLRVRRLDQDRQSVG